MSLDDMIKYFPSTINHYRSALNKNEQLIYDHLRSGLLKYSSQITISEISIARIQTIYDYIRLDNPYIFFVRSLSVKQNTSNNTTVIFPDYRFSIDKTKITMYSLLTTCRNIIKTIRSQSILETEKNIHDYLCKNVKYDYLYAESSFECIGPLLFHKGVCEGISKSAKIIMDLLQINSFVQYGYACNSRINNGNKTDSHAWNIVFISPYYYHCDITFDLSLKYNDLLRYDYFNISDQEILIDHSWDRSLTMPCTFSLNYYNSHNLLFKSLYEVDHFISSSIIQRKRNIIFQLTNAMSMTAWEKLISVSLEKNILKEMLYCQYELSINEPRFIVQIFIQYL